MVNNELYAKIYEEIDNILPYNWDELVIYLEYGDASYSFAFYIKSNNKYIKCFDIPELDNETVMKTFEKIDSFVTVERNKLEKKWSNMTMVIDASGKMKTDIDYTDLTLGTYKYKKEWKLKYLN